MTIPVYILDTFTAEKFKGNPTAVCILHRRLSDSLMRSIAMELNFPVTAFVVNDPAFSTFNIQYFTVTGEIPACGHATLAAARIMSELSNKLSVRFTTKENILLQARVEGDIILMKYPKFPIREFAIAANTISSLGLDSYKSCFYCAELETLFIEIDGAGQLEKLNPNYRALQKSDGRIKEVVVTSLAGDRAFDFLLRSFCPWIGINEDPVTGSVHSALAPFWERKLGKSELKAWQASSRGGDVYVNVLADQVEIGGRTVNILTGQLTA